MLNIPLQNMLYLVTQLISASEPTYILRASEEIADCYDSESRVYLEQSTNSFVVTLNPLNKEECKKFPLGVRITVATDQLTTDYTPDGYEYNFTYGQTNSFKIQCKDLVAGKCSNFLKSSAAIVRLESMQYFTTVQAGLIEQVLANDTNCFYNAFDIQANKRVSNVSFTPSKVCYNAYLTTQCGDIYSVTNADQNVQNATVTLKFKNGLSKQYIYEKNKAGTYIILEYVNQLLQFCFDDANAMDPLIDAEMTDATLVVVPIISSKLHQTSGNTNIMFFNTTNTFYDDFTIKYSETDIQSNGIYQAENVADINQQFDDLYGNRDTSKVSVQYFTIYNNYYKITKRSPNYFKYIDTTTYFVCDDGDQQCIDEIQFMYVENQYQMIYQVIAYDENKHVKIIILEEVKNEITSTWKSIKSEVTTKGIDFVITQSTQNEETLNDDFTLSLRVQNNLDLELIEISQKIVKPQQIEQYKVFIDLTSQQVTDIQKYKYVLLLFYDKDGVKREEIQLSRLEKSMDIQVNNLLTVFGICILCTVIWSILNSVFELIILPHLRSKKQGKKVLERLRQKQLTDEDM